MLELLKQDSTESEYFLDTVRCLEESFQELIIWLGSNLLLYDVLYFTVLIGIYLRELNASCGQFIVIIPKYYIIYLRSALLSPSNKLLLEALHKLLNKNGSLRSLMDTVPIHSHNLICKNIRHHILFLQCTSLSGWECLLSLGPSFLHRYRVSDNVGAEFLKQMEWGKSQ